MIVYYVTALFASKEGRVIRGGNGAHSYTQGDIMCIDEDGRNSKGALVDKSSEGSPNLHPIDMEPGDDLQSLAPESNIGRGFDCKALM